MLTADDRAQIRAELDPAQQAERWRSLALRLLDELEAAEAKRGDDTELAGEVDVLRKDNTTLKEALRDIRHVVAEELTGNINAHAVVAVKQLANAYRSEKDRADRLQRSVELCEQTTEKAGVALREARVDGIDIIAGIEELAADRDRLQRENETLRAARESLEPIGWAYSSGSPTSCEGTCWYVTTHICPSGERRRVYLAPPEPLEATP